MTAGPDPSTGTAGARPDDVARELAAARAELAATIDAYKAFAYSVSHDLRAPLRAIAGFSAMLQDDAADQLSDDARGLLGTIVENVHVLSAQLDGLLVLSRLSHRELEPQALDMAAIAADAVAEMRRLDPERAVAVTIGALAPATADHGLMRTAFLELLKNAWKFTRPREAPAVAIDGARGAAEIVYRVRDNGVGVPANAASRLFVPFGRVHGRHDFEGLGIGLAAVKTIVARHGGRVWVESEPGCGATFAFALPG